MSQSGTFPQLDRKLQSSGPVIEKVQELNDCGKGKTPPSKPTEIRVNQISMWGRSPVWSTKLKQDTGTAE